jgi:hypothetical protein
MTLLIQEGHHDSDYMRIAACPSDMIFLLLALAKGRFLYIIYYHFHVDENSLLHVTGKHPSPNGIRTLNHKVDRQALYLTELKGTSLVVVCHYYIWYANGQHTVRGI